MRLPVLAAALGAPSPAITAQQADPDFRGRPQPQRQSRLRGRGRLGLIAAVSRRSFLPVAGGRRRRLIATAG